MLFPKRIAQVRACFAPDKSLPKVSRKEIVFHLNSNRLVKLLWPFHIRLGHSNRRPVCRSVPSKTGLIAGLESYNLQRNVSICFPQTLGRANNISWTLKHNPVNLWSGLLKLPVYAARSQQRAYVT